MMEKAFYDGWADAAAAAARAAAAAGQSAKKRGDGLRGLARIHFSQGFYQNSGYKWTPPQKPHG